MAPLCFYQIICVPDPFFIKKIPVTKNSVRHLKFLSFLKHFLNRDLNIKRIVPGSENPLEGTY